MYYCTIVKGCIGRSSTPGRSYSKEAGNRVVRISKGLYYGLEIGLSMDEHPRAEPKKRHSTIKKVRCVKVQIDNHEKHYDVVNHTIRASLSCSNLSKISIINIYNTEYQTLVHARTIGIFSPVQ